MLEDNYHDTSKPYQHNLTVKFTIGSDNAGAPTTREFLDGMLRFLKYLTINKHLLECEIDKALKAKEDPEEEPDFESWTATELFNYLMTNFELSEDEEFENWKHSRDEMIDMCKEHWDDKA